MEIISKKKKNFETLVFAFVMCVMALFLLWKAHQGYIFNDEPFMVSLGHRILKGDKLFIHEWNLTQTTGLFFAPFIWLYTTVTKQSTVGLILFCRIVYVFWWLLVGAILFRRMKQYGWIRIVAVVMFLLYTPLDEMTLTYNAMALSLLLLFVSYFFIDGNTILDYLNGVILAFAVLAYPTLIVIYFVYLIAVIIQNNFLIPKKQKTSRKFSWKVCARITAAAAVIAILFCSYIFSGGIQTFFESLGLIFTFESGRKQVLIKLIYYLWKEFPIQTVIGSLTILASLLDRNRNRRSIIYMFIQIALFSISMFSVIVSDFYLFNVILIPLSFLGLQTYIFLREKDCVLTFAVICGVIYAFCAGFSSDTGLLAFSNGFAIIDIICVIVFFQYFSESLADRESVHLRRVIAIALAFAMIVQVGSELYLKILRTYWDEVFPALNTEIQVGSAKGIITTVSNAENYESVYDDIQTIRSYTNNDKELEFLSLTLFPSIYLDMDYNYGCFSSWTYYNNGLNYDVLNDKLLKFYEKYPEKMPDIVYICSSDLEYLELITCIDFTGYSTLELKTGKVYIKR